MYALVITFSYCLDSTSVEEDESVTEGNRTANADALFTQTTSQENFLASK